MKRIVEKLSRNELRKNYPVDDLVPGWFFRVSETSNMAWLAEGKDQWGREVSCRGDDDQSALRNCADQARHISDALAAKRGQQLEP